MTDALFEEWRAYEKLVEEEEMTTLIDHVWSCDFPESLSTYDELGTRAGYERVVSLAEDDLNRLVVLETSTS